MNRENRVGRPWKHQQAEETMPPVGMLSVSAEKDACSACPVAPAAGVPGPRSLPVSRSSTWEQVKLRLALEVG